MPANQLELTLGQSCLRCVPAVHFRVAFAAHVNTVCRDFRPDAIAVELGPETAAAARAWLSELGTGPASRRPLPCMLGLLKANRRIRPSKREAAVRLQQVTGRNLNELPPELLKELLGYSSVRVLYLSPTDSILEAMRCALELEVPLYGVDLEESAERTGEPAMLQDPTMAWKDVVQYVERNAPFAEAQRDEEIDSRRETVMAARVKGLLAKHRRVAFTCGLAHWPRLRQLLADAETRPTPVADAAQITPQGFRRVVVHPSLAIYHLDVFPRFAAGYEESRITADQRRSFQPAHSPATMFREMLDLAYERHFARFETSQLDRRHEDLESRNDLERLLINLCSVKQLQVPDLFTAMTAAQGVMSEPFRNTLASVLMEFPWATAEDWPELSVLAPTPSPRHSFLRAELTDRKGRRGPTFCIDPLPGRGGGSYRVEIPVPSNWAEKYDAEEGRDDRPWRFWNPRDYLKTAMSARAIELARHQREDSRSEAFEGALMDGVDVKTTLRAHTRGEDRVYVRVAKPRRRQHATATIGDGFPIVWILRPEVQTGGALSPSGDFLKILRPKIQDQDGLAKVERERGSCVLIAVDYSTSGPDPRIHINGRPVKRQVLMGFLLFQPPHFEWEQSAAWIEQTKYERSPFLNALTMDGVNAFYRREHGIDPCAYDWPVALVLMGIPYARHANGTLTVGAPDRFALPRVTAEFAVKHSVRIQQIPLSYFPREELEKMATDYTVPILGETGNDYSSEVERAMGESQTAYRNLVPQKWLTFGKRSPGAK
jgi:hypothetical protein